MRRACNRHIHATGGTLQRCLRDTAMRGNSNLSQVSKGELSRLHFIHRGLHMDSSGLDGPHTLPSAVPADMHLQPHGLGPVWRRRHLESTQCGD